MNWPRQLIPALLGLLLCATPAKAQQNITTDTAVEEITATADVTGMEEENTNLAPVDTVLNTHRIRIPADSVASWKNAKQLAYLQHLDSLLAATQEKELAQPARTPRSTTPSFLQQLLDGSLFKILAWLVAIFFVGMILFRFMKNKGFFRKDTFATAGSSETGDSSEELPQDLDALLHQAHKLGDYRMATRYQFLKTLQLLQQKDLVTYAADKTNSRYAAELPVHWRKEFATLVRLYEYTWYGHFKIGKEQYQQLAATYTSFNEKI